MEHARSGESGTRHAHLQSPAGPPRPAARKRSTLLSRFAGLNLDIRHGGKRAFCAPADDYIRMPPVASFRSPEAYYAVLAHECVHHSRLLASARKRLTVDP